MTETQELRISLNIKTTTYISIIELKMFIVIVLNSVVHFESITVCLIT